MQRYSLGLLLLVAAVAPVGAQAAKPLLETWQAAYFEGLKVGHMHTLVKQTGTGDDVRIHTHRTMQLVIKRYESVMPITLEQTTVETKAGKILSLGMTQQLAKDAKVVYAGEVEGDHVVVKVNGAAGGKLPYDAASVGLYAQEVFFRAKKVKPGDKLSVVSYEILLGGPITIRAEVKDKEKVDRLEAKKTKDGKVEIVREPVTLLRVESTPDPVTVGGQKIQLPARTVWLDGTLMPARELFEMPGIGAIVVYTTTKEAALKDGVAPDRLPDFGLNINIPVRQTIDDPYRTTEATYRVTWKTKLDKVFAEDDRQKVEGVTDKGLELTVTAQREPGTNPAAARPGAEYVESNTFIDSGDPGIKALARKVTEKTADPWKQAVRIERWVHENMKRTTAAGFPNASVIAKNLEGDCRQHAMLMVALCRALGIPARTAIGLLYVREPGASPFFGFHMWGEVWVNGKWVALDPMIGEGGVGATHLKMGDHSWAKTATLAPFLPIQQALGKLQIEVVRSK